MDRNRSPRRVTVYALHSSVMHAKRDPIQQRASYACFVAGVLVGALLVGLLRSLP